jgi:hypothetical protein
MAILLALTPPAIVKAPPATKSPLGRTASALTLPSIPETMATQLEPFQRAIRFVMAPPVIVKAPPAMRSPFGMVASV